MPSGLHGDAMMRGGKAKQRGGAGFVDWQSHGPPIAALAKPLRLANDGNPRGRSHDLGHLLQSTAFWAESRGWSVARFARQAPPNQAPTSSKGALPFTGVAQLHV